MSFDYDKAASDNTVAILSKADYQNKYGIGYGGGIGSSNVAIAPIEIPKPSLTVSDDNEKNTTHNVLSSEKETVHEIATQNIPYSLVPNITKLLWSDYIEPGETYKSLKVTDENGNDVTSKFNITVSNTNYDRQGTTSYSKDYTSLSPMPTNNNIIADAKPDFLSNLDFYNHTYYFDLSVNINPLYAYLYSIGNGKYSIQDTNNIALNQDGTWISNGTAPITTDWYDDTMANQPLAIMQVPNINFGTHVIGNTEYKVNDGTKNDDNKLIIGSTILNNTSWTVNAKLSTITNASDNQLSNAQLAIKLNPIKSELTGTTKASSKLVKLVQNGSSQQIINMESGMENWDTAIDTEQSSIINVSASAKPGAYSGVITYSLTETPAN